MTSASGGGSTPPAGVLEHHFRHHYARLVAVLVGRVGLSHLETVEDVVQDALLVAHRAWERDGVPADPTAWLYRVAHRDLLDALRKERRHNRILDAAAARAVSKAITEPEPPAFEGEVKDELLRMLFVCCADEIPRDSRLVLALKTLCGFSVSEIAFRLFTTEANVYKRLERARARLSELAVDTETPPLEALRSRLSSVRSVLYLLFNEGYLSLHDDAAIRVELCDEAIRLGGALAEHPVGGTPETFALLALMHLHAARLAARQDASGGLLLLEEQDRSLWDAAHLGAGAHFLERAAQGEELSRFHVEAAIAAEHCFAPSFAETKWSKIAGLYRLLEHTEPSPIHVLNRAIATAEAEGAEAGLALLEGVVPPSWLAGHYLFDAALADLYRRAGRGELALRHRDAALEAAPSDALRALMRRRLAEP